MGGLLKPHQQKDCLFARHLLGDAHVDYDVLKLSDCCVSGCYCLMSLHAHSHEHCINTNEIVQCFCKCVLYNTNAIKLPVNRGFYGCDGLSYWSRSFSSPGSTRLQWPRCGQRIFHCPFLRPGPVACFVWLTLD